MADPMTLNVEGMTCGGCVRSVQTIISKSLDLDPVDVNVDLDEHVATFTPPEGADIELLLEKLDNRGFTSQVAS